jgi:hypothetical protein
MTEVTVKPADLKLINDALSTVSLPTWSETCDKSYDKCSATWKQVVGPVVGIK